MDLNIENISSNSATLDFNTPKASRSTVSKNMLSNKQRAVNPSQTNLSENSSTDNDSRGSKRIDYSESDRAIIAGALESVAETAELIRWYRERYFAGHRSIH